MKEMTFKWHGKFSHIFMNCQHQNTTKTLNTVCILTKFNNICIKNSFNVYQITNHKVSYWYHFVNIVYQEQFLWLPPSQKCQPNHTAMCNNFLLGYLVHMTCLSNRQKGGAITVKKIQVHRRLMYVWYYTSNINVCLTKTFHRTKHNLSFNWHNYLIESCTEAIMHDSIT